MPDTSPQLTAIDTRNQVLLERLKEGEHKKFAPFLKRIEKAVRERLSKAGDTIETKKKLNAILSDVRLLQKDIYDDYNKQLALDLGEIGINQSEFEAESYNKVVANFESKIPSAEQVLTAIRVNPMQLSDYTGKQLLEPFIKDWSDSQIQRVSNTITQGFYQGQTNAEITRAIRGTKANKYNDGELAKINRSNRTIVRTAIQNVSSQARLETMKQNSNLIKGYKWVSTLDSRTSVQCFTGATSVAPCFDIDKLYRANYSGEIITITLATGEKVEGTPNHPILTQHGWTTLGELDPSKHVTYAACNKVVDVIGNKGVGMKTTFSELYDSISKSSVCDIASIRTSATDFYGDAVRFNGKVNVINTKSHLSSDIKPTKSELVENKRFRLILWFSSFFAFCAPLFSFNSRLKVIKTPKLTPSRLESAKKTAFRYVESSLYFGRSKPIVKHLYSVLFGNRDTIRNVPSSNWIPDSELVKKASDSGSGGFVALSDTSSGFSVEVSKCNIIGKSSEFKSCHVYTLQTGQGYYISGGVIVKNCTALDGREFKLGEGPLAPLHPNCRSTMTPLLSSSFDFLDKGATRASIDGPVSTKETYFSWLKKQPVAFQNDAIGIKRAKLLRDGGLSSEQFARLSLNRNFQPLTLEEMKKKAPNVFETAKVKI